MLILFVIALIFIRKIGMLKLKAGDSVAYLEISGLLVMFSVN